jgi:hypothetical protein
MKLVIILCTLLVLSACAQIGDMPDKEKETQNWTHYVRTSGHGLNKTNIEKTILDAQETYLFGIEVDNDPPGRYSSFLDPTEKLEALEILARRAHEIDNYASIYVAGLECITANANQKEHSFFKDHPDWVQRDINNRPAMFGGGDAFWIREGDEDVWITPYAQEWRSIYMEHIRKIAKTGIDGIFVDIPYWMTHFDGWEDTWASFDEYTVAAFKKKTSLDAKKNLKLGDFKDKNFRLWVDFRIKSLTEFMAEVNRNAKSVNPECKVIAEIYPGINEAAVRVGADVYEMYNVVDVITHEFSGGGGNAANKNPLDWFSRMAGMYTFRAFADGKASWMLSYSWDKKNKVNPGEAMKNLMLSNVMAGTNCWDASGHVMSGSNDIETRKTIFKWISEHEKIFYKPRTPIKPIGVYFSQKTRNYFPEQFINAYHGIMYLLLQAHLEFQVVTPRTLKDYKGEILILPDVKCISDEEINYLRSYVQDGNGLMVTGESGRFDGTGAENENNAIHQMLKITDPGQKQVSKDKTKIIYMPDCPGKNYLASCQDEFNRDAWAGEGNKAEYKTLQNEFILDITKTFEYRPEININASSFVSVQIANVENRPSVFIANYKGLKRDEVAKQIPEENITISFPYRTGIKIYYLPFLGEKMEISGKIENNRLICTLPAIEKGGVVWLE